MYESDRLPESWVARINVMDQDRFCANYMATLSLLGPTLQFFQVWVPSQFAVEQFAKSGVHREKIAILPEARHMLPCGQR